MDPGGLGNVLPHHVHHIVEHLHGIQGGTSCFRSPGSMRRLPGKGELHLYIGQAGRPVHRIAGVGMPVQHCVQPFKNAFPHHVGLSTTAFFRRATEQFHRTGKARGGQPLGHGHSARNRAGSQQVVPAGMPCRTGDQHFLIRNRILRHARNSVIFRHHPDNR